MILVHYLSINPLTPFSYFPSTILIWSSFMHPPPSNLSSFSKIKDAQFKYTWSYCEWLYLHVARVQFVFSFKFIQVRLCEFMSVCVSSSLPPCVHVPVKIYIHLQRMNFILRYPDSVRVLMSIQLYAANDLIRFACAMGLEAAALCAPQGGDNVSV